MISTEAPVNGELGLEDKLTMCEEMVKTFSTFAYWLSRARWDEDAERLAQESISAVTEHTDIERAGAARVFLDAIKARAEQISSE